MTKLEILLDKTNRQLKHHQSTIVGLKSSRVAMRYEMKGLEDGVRYHKHKLKDAMRRGVGKDVSYHHCRLNVLREKIKDKAIVIDVTRSQIRIWVGEAASLKNTISELIGAIELTAETKRINKVFADMDTNIAYGDAAGLAKELAAEVGDL